MKRLQLFPRKVGLISVLSLLVLAFVFGKMQGGFVSWFLFYAFLTVAVYESFVFLFTLHRVEVTREVSRKRLSAGGKLEVRLKISRPAFVPVPWLWVEDHVPITLNPAPKLGAKLLFPWFKTELTYSYECTQLLRGRHKWHLVTVQSGDLFGLVQQEKRTELADEVLIYPQVRHIPVWPTVHENNAGAAVVLNRVSEDVTSVIGVRDYVHGDRLGRIHWKATAKGMGLKTKEFEFQTSNDFMFFLDRRSTAYGPDKHLLFERAVSLVASLSRYALNRRFTAGLVSYGKERYVQPPARHPNTLVTIYEHLAIVAADSQFPFDKTLFRETVYLPHGTTVVCVTPQLGAELIAAISQLRARRTKVELFWVRQAASMSEPERSDRRALERLGVPVRLVHHDRFEEIVRERNVTSA